MCGKHLDVHAREPGESRWPDAISTGQGRRNRKRVCLVMRTATPDGVVVKLHRILCTTMEIEASLEECMLARGRTRPPLE